MTLPTLLRINPHQYIIPEYILCREKLNNPYALKPKFLGVGLNKEEFIIPTLGSGKGTRSPLPKKALRFAGWLNRFIWGYNRILCSGCIKEDGDYYSGFRC